MIWLFVQAEKIADKALCFVQPILKNGTSSAYASTREVGGAAYTLLRECVIRRGVGGIAADIGMQASQIACSIVGIFIV